MKFQLICSVYGGLQLNEAENEMNASNLELTNFSATGCGAMKGEKEQKRPHYISLPSH